MFYGWYLWTYRGREKVDTAITHLTVNLFTKIALLCTVGMLASHTLLSHYTNSEVALWDSAIVVLSLSAQWMLCQKIFECWILWFIVDAMVMGLHLVKGIPFHAGLHFTYLFLAVAGHWNWKRLQNKPA